MNLWIITTQLLALLQWIKMKMIMIQFWHYTTILYECFHRATRSNFRERCMFSSCCYIFNITGCYYTYIKHVGTYDQTSFSILLSFLKSILKTNLDIQFNQNLKQKLWIYMLFSVLRGICYHDLSQIKPFFVCRT